MNFYISVHKFYSSAPDEFKITAENLTDREEELVRRASVNFDDYDFQNLSFLYPFNSCHGFDPQEVFAGLVAFRIELLPQVIANFTTPEFYGVLFRDHLDVEHLFFHKFISNEPNFDCNFRNVYDVNFDNTWCTPSPSQTASHSEIYFEYQLTD